MIPTGSGRYARVACIGAITVDHAFTLQDEPCAGTSNPAKRTVGRGGVAHNVARNLVSLHCGASLVTVAGDDSEGRSLLNGAEAAGIDTTSSALLPHANSGSYTAVLRPDGDLHLGVSDLRICDAIDSAFIDSRWGEIGTAELIFADCNLPAATLDALRVRCHREQRELFVDAVSVAKSARLPVDLTGIDTVFANRDEAIALTRLPAEADGAELAAAVVTLGATLAIVTDSAAGLHWARAGESGSMPAADGAVRDVNGAGDALIAGFMAGRLQQRRLATCLGMGLRAAALTAGIPGSVNPDLRPEALLPVPGAGA